MNDSPIPAADLDLLCQRYGISLSYRDIWFHDHATPEATKRALLVAMGVPLEGPLAGEVQDTGTPALVHIEGDPDPVVTGPASTRAPQASAALEAHARARRRARRRVRRRARRRWCAADRGS